MCDSATVQLLHCKLWTIGHSTHSIERFLELLSLHQIQQLVDIRRFPGSRKFPHFSQENLQQAVGERDIAYCWLEGLGGRRSKNSSGASSLNEGLRNQSFRNYGDWMLADGFRNAFAELSVLAGSNRTAIMCSESVFWRCHRRLVSDYAVASGGTVFHIFPDGRERIHQLTKGAVVQDDPIARVIYPGEPTLF